MYTEFILGCNLSKDISKECVDAIDYVINGEEKKPKYKNPETYEEIMHNRHYIERTTLEDDIKKFIREYDLYYLFGSSSYYFGGASPVSKFYYDDIDNEYHITIRSDLKNYTGQIEKFINYITPYVVQGSGYPHEIFAYVQYEEDEFPTIYAMDGEYDISMNVVKREKT